MTITVTEPLIRQLCQPSAHPDNRGDIELIETHISWVLLIGSHAYKIKKPVDLGFANFTTLDRRKHFCEMEIQLNRRLAERLYLDVVPITGTPETPRFGGTGEPIEYAVRMKRFNQENLLNRLIKQGRLAATHIDSLAKQVAEFHEAAEVSKANTQFGTPDSVREAVVDNFETLIPALAEPLRAIAKELEEWSLFHFDKLREEFEHRKRSGMVRACHGDMHLGNMFLEDDEVVVFDGIEFNESFRWIDIMNEVAFAVMDLEDRGRPDFANRFLNKWLEHSGDYGGLRLLRFYLLYRAMVRAKVDAIRLNQGDLDLSERRHLTSDCQGYLKLARRYTEPIAPKLVITSGPSGSGKTTGTEDLIERTGAIRVRSDVERKRLHGLSPLDSSGGRIYSAEDTRRTYDRLTEVATQIVEAGFTAVVDATFLKREERDRFGRLARRLGVPFLILKFEASPDLLRQRIRNRQAESDDASEADIAVLEAQLATAEPLDAVDEPHEVMAPPVQEERSLRD